MPVTSLRTVRGTAWIPPNTHAQIGFTVTRSDGTVDTLTNQIVHLKIEDGVTESIGRFEFSIWNHTGNYTDVWSGNEIVRYYSDYAATATTLRFRGRIEKVSYTENMVRVSGRSEALRLMEVTVTKSYTNQETSVILIDLISNYGSEYTTSNVNISTTSLTINWFQKPFWECVQELCKAANFDCYLDANLDIHYFESSTVRNTTDAIVHDINLLETGEFAKDVTQVRNRIIVYGASQEGTQIVYTAEDTTSQTSYGVREEIIKNDNITSYTSARELGDSKLADSKNPPIVGDVKTILLATIQPGEQVQISDPDNGLDKNYYDIISYTHDINNEQGDYSTILKINKEPRRISHLFKAMLERETSKQETNINPYEMRQSYDFLFNEDSGTHSTTQINTGVLKISSGGSGTWVSPTRTAGSNISQAYLIGTGSTLTGATFEVSNDGGITYRNILIRERITFVTVGSLLVIRITLTDTTTEIDSLSVQYK